MQEPAGGTSKLPTFNAATLRISIHLVLLPLPDIATLDSAQIACMDTWTLSCHKVRTASYSKQTCTPTHARMHTHTHTPTHTLSLSPTHTYPPTPTPPPPPPPPPPPTCKHTSSSVLLPFVCVIQQRLEQQRSVIVSGPVGEDALVQLHFESSQMVRRGRGAPHRLRTSSRQRRLCWRICACVCVCVYVCLCICVSVT